MPKKLTRKQMVGRIYTLDGSVLLRYKTFYWDQWGRGVVDIYEAKTTKGKIVDHFVLSEDRNDYWYKEKK